MKGRKWLATFGVGFLLVVVVAGVLLGVAPDKGVAEDHPDRGLPVVEISLNDTNIETMASNGKDVKYGGNTLTLRGGTSGVSGGGVSGGTTAGVARGGNRGGTEEAVTYTGVEIKGRGNATWGQPKKPWQIKFSEKTDFLGLGKGKKWVFLANYYDWTYLRSATAMYVAEMIGEKFAPTGEFVELYVDGEYQGLYFVTRKTEVGRNSVDLRDPAGVLVELDNVYGHSEIFYTTQAGNTLVLTDEVDKTQSELGMARFLSDFSRLEQAAEARNWRAVTEVADVRSFAEYFMLSELIANADAYFTSEYFYKDGVADKIHAGPGWDFDMTFGTKNWGGFEPTVNLPRRGELEDWPRYNEETGELKEWEQYGNIAKIFFQLIEIPEFRAEVSALWQERMSGRGQELMIFVQEAAKRIRPAAVADAEKWEREDFDAGVAEMLEWIRIRYQYFEENYGNGVTAEQNVV